MKTLVNVSSGWRLFADLVAHGDECKAQFCQFCLICGFERFTSGENKVHAALHLREQDVVCLACEFGQLRAVQAEIFPSSTNLLGRGGCIVLLGLFL